MIKMKKSKFIAFIAMVVAATLLAAAGGYFVFTGVSDVSMVSAEKQTEMADIEAKYGKLYKPQNMVNSTFYGKVDEAAQMDAMYKALVDSLGDKYSRYMTKEEFAAWQNYVNGTFYGIGVSFTQEKDGDFVVTKVLDGGPADLAGIKAGDLLTAIDGKLYRDSDEMAAHMKGKEGTKVEITYSHNGRQKSADIVRAKLAEPSVYAGIIDKKYGYIRITAFEETTAEQFKTELANLENKNVKGLIIDLRNNPGGVVSQGIEIADALLPEGTITYTEDNAGKKEYHNSDENFTKLKYVVLVNENTASSSEIIAAAIKDNKGGKLVGAKTFGKGIIQGTIPFDDGTAVILTFQQYFSPNGKQIHGKGVAPDYPVKLPKNAKTDTQLEKALELLK